MYIANVYMTSPWNGKTFVLVYIDGTVEKRLCFLTNQNITIALLGFHVCVFEKSFLIVHDREHLLCLMFVW